VPATYILTYNCSNKFGLSSSISRTVVVVCTIAPMLSLASYALVFAQAATANLTALLPRAVVSSYYYATSRITVTTNASSVNVFPSGSLPVYNTVQYTAVDPSGNVNVTAVQILINDTLKPVVTLNGASPLLHPGGLAYTDPGYTVYDALDSALHRNIPVVTTYTLVQQGKYISAPSCIYSSAANFAVPPPPYNRTGGYSAPKTSVGQYAAAGTAYFTLYSATDHNGNVGTTNRSVQIVDTQAPQLFLNGGAQITWQFNPNSNATYVDPGVTAVDNLDGIITAYVCVAVTAYHPAVSGVMRQPNPFDISGLSSTGPFAVSAIVINAPVGTVFLMNYTATDGAGNVGYVTRLVLISNTVPPVITLLGAANFFINFGTAFYDPYLTATDLSDTPAQMTYSQQYLYNQPLNVRVSGTYYLQYMVTDRNGNAASVIRNITVLPRPTEAQVPQQNLALLYLETPFYGFNLSDITAIEDAVSNLTNAFAIVVQVFDPNNATTLETDNVPQPRTGVYARRGPTVNTTVVVIGCRNITDFSWLCGAAVLVSLPAIFPARVGQFTAINATLPSANCSFSGSEPSPSASLSSSAVGAAVGAGVVGVLALLLLAALVYYRHKRRRTANNTSGRRRATQVFPPSADSSDLTSMEKTAPPRRATMFSMSISRHETRRLSAAAGAMVLQLDAPNVDVVMMEQVQLDKEIGATPRGMAFLGLFKEQSVYAVRAEHPAATLTLQREAVTLSQLSHNIHIQQLVAVCQSPPMLVLEQAGLGSLRDYLRRCRAAPPVQPGLLMSLMRQLAEALCYLATKGIIHGHLQAHSMVVATGPLLKVGCFAYAGTEATRPFARSPLHFRWLAPELLTMDNGGLSRTLATDVWSAAVVLWEVCSVGATPYTDCSNRQELVKQLSLRKRLTAAAYAPPGFGELLMDCWSSKAEDRLKMAEVQSKLLGMEMVGHINAAQLGSIEPALEQETWLREKAAEDEGELLGMVQNPLVAMASENMETVVDVSYGGQADYSGLTPDHKVYAAIGGGARSEVQSVQTAAAASVVVLSREDGYQDLKPGHEVYASHQYEEPGVLEAKAVVYETPLNRRATQWARPQQATYAVVAPAGAVAEVEAAYASVDGPSTAPVPGVPYATLRMAQDFPGFGEDEEEEEDEA
jgi:hypothetical protein